MNNRRVQGLERLGYKGVVCCIHIAQLEAFSSRGLRLRALQGSKSGEMERSRATRAAHLAGNC